MSQPSQEKTRGNILVVEDSSVFREMQGLLFGQAGYSVVCLENPRDALQVAGARRFDLVVIDYELPDMNGQEFMHAVRKLHPEIAVVFVSGALTLNLAIQLSSQGVAGIFNKPANPKQLLEKVNETLARNAVRDTAARTGSQSPLGRHPEAALPQREPTADQLAYTPRYFLGQSDAFREFTHRIWKVRDFRAVLLLQGEPGSPFELIARDLAGISIFRDGPLMVCDAAQFEPRPLIEVLAPSLLSQDAGTLVVTGIERFTAAQQKTLEHLMTGRDVFLPFARRFRLLLAATNELSDHVDAGRFDETLYYKISSLTLAVPGLRQLRGDIVANAERILQADREAGNAVAPAGLEPAAAAWLEAREWPGNYDQLARTVLAAAAASEGGLLSISALEAALPADGAAFATRGAAQASAATSATRPPVPGSSGVTAATAPISFAGKSRAAPKPVLTAQSLFRPASRSYQFGTRLAESVATAEAAG